MRTLSTSRLKKGDVVEMASGGSRDIGRRFLILDPPSPLDSLHLTYATKAGLEDRRHTPWTGWYGDCTWRLIHRAEAA